MEKETDRRRENLSIINKITLLISKEDSQTPGRDLVFILKADRPTADQNLYLQNIYFIYPLYISLHYVFIFFFGVPITRKNNCADILSLSFLYTPRRSQFYLFNRLFISAIRDRRLCYY